MRRAAGRIYRRCAAPFGRRALDRMVDAGLPRELDAPLRVLLGDRPPPRTAAVAETVERRRAEIASRADVYRFAYADAAGTARWPDEQSRASGGEPVSLRWLASGASVPARCGMFLQLCADAVEARTVLEMGTGTGISGAYLAASRSIEQLLTLEGSPPLISMAATTIATVSDRASILEGPFESELPRALASLRRAGRSLDLVYVDGHHDGAAMLRYVETMRPHLRRGSLLLLDDIRLWQEMWLAWRSLASMPGVTAAVDTGRFGMLVWDGEARGTPPQFELARYTGWWRVGPPRPPRPATG
jgi:predicted O-methyltransferase YrrM